MSASPQLPGRLRQPLKNPSADLQRGLNVYFGQEKNALSLPPSRQTGRRPAGVTGGVTVSANGISASSEALPPAIDW
jgi:hypothetical protein